MDQITINSPTQDKHTSGHKPALSRIERRKLKDSGKIGDSGGGWTPRQLQLFMRAKKFGWILIIAQLIFLLGFSTFEYKHFELTWDFSIYNQAYFLISHGHLNPFDTILKYHFWQNHGEFIMWPLALLRFILPSTSTLLYVQDLAVFAGQVAAFAWICERVRKRDLNSFIKPYMFVILGATLLVFNPWPLWSIAFDFHMETLAPSLVIMAAWDFDRDKNRAWLWVALIILCGDVPATYLAGLAISVFLAKKGWRRGNRKPLLTAILLFGAGAGWLMFMSASGGDRGSGLVGGYSYLAFAGATPTQMSTTKLIAGLIKNPTGIASVLIQRRSNVYANIAPGGIIGFFTPWGFGVPLVGLLENNLHEYGLFGVPGFQSMCIYGLVAIGTVDAVYFISRRSIFEKIKRLIYVPKALLIIIIANVLLWAIIWYPAAFTHWLRVPTPTANVLTRFANEVPVSDDLIISQGVAGRFSSRAHEYLLMGPGYYAVDTSPTYFIFTPYAGAEVFSVAGQLAMIKQVSLLPNCKLIDHGSGAWLFKWYPPKGTTKIYFPEEITSVATWAGQSAIGQPSVNGSPLNWAMTSNSNKSGYAVSGIYWWINSNGTYNLHITLKTNLTGVYVEVWNATSNQMIMQREVSSTDTRQSLNYYFATGGFYPNIVSNGVGPFSIDALQPGKIDQYELKVYTPGGGLVKIYDAKVVQLTGPSTSLSNTIPQQINN